MLTEEQKRMAEENYKLVPYVLNLMHKNYDDWHGLAAVALCEATQTYNPDRGAFTTYAILRIRSEIMKKLDYDGRKMRNPGEEILSLDMQYDNSDCTNVISMHDIIGDKYWLKQESVVEWNMILGILGQREKEFLSLYASGYRMVEIAKFYQTSPQNVSRIIINARRKLRKAAG